MRWLMDLVIQALYSGMSRFSSSLLLPLPCVSYFVFVPSCRLRQAYSADTISHEIAYIFGQLCSPYSVPSLLSRLRDPEEDDMVRHEAAEALGGIASDGADFSVDVDDEVEARDDEGGNHTAAGRDEEDEGLPEGGVLGILREWAVKPDAPVVVRESCQVAIDMWEVSVCLQSHGEDHWLMMVVRTLDRAVQST